MFTVVLLVMLVCKVAKLSILSLRSILLPTLVFVGVTAPYLLAMAAFSDDYNMERIVPSFYHPVNQYRPMWRYFWNDWVWGKTWQHLTMQFDLPLLFMIILGGLGFTLYRDDDRTRTVNALWGRLAPLLPLIILFAMTMILQDCISAPFYKHFPGARYLQFPWRILGLMTPVMIIMALYLVEKSFSGSVATAITCFCLVWMVAICGAFSPIQYGRLTSFGPPFGGLNFSSYGEYVPKAVTSGVPPSLDQVIAADRASGCSLEIYRPESEVKNMVYKCVCDRQAHVTLPLFASYYHRASLIQQNGSKSKISFADNPDFPGLYSVLLPPGESEVLVEMPNILTVIETYLNKLSSGNQ